MELLPVRGIVKENSGFAVCSASNAEIEGTGIIFVFNLMYSRGR
jgi:hypothetical protein